MRARFRQAAKWVWQHLLVVSSAIWLFLGRVGLAFRNLLIWIIWKPLFYLTMPVWLPLRWILWDSLAAAVPPVWRFVGRMGLALRHLLTAYLWRGFVTLVVRPFIWLYQRVLKPSVLWLLHTVWRFILWLGQQIRRFGNFIWQKSAPQRAVYGRRVSSRWRLLKANLRLAMRRPKPPISAQVAPKRPRENLRAVRTFRLATAVAALALIVVVGMLSMRESQPTAVADDRPFETATPQIIVLTPTPQPPTPTVLPTVSVKLTPWATPNPLDGGGAVIFTQHVAGNSDIYILPVDQADPIRLTTHPAADRDPAWGPDGTEIAFASRRDGNWELYVYNIPNRELRRVTRDLAYDAAPSWSPDGQWLAYESYRDGNLDIFLIKADGSEGPFRLTDSPWPDFEPAWSPGGRHIAFTSLRSGSRDIFVRSLDAGINGGVVNLTQTPDLDEDEAAFSPDGRTLVYAEHSAGFPVIYALPLTEAYQPAAPAYSLGQQGHSPAWSPDRRSMLFVYDQGERSFLLSGSVEAWSAVPQMFVTDGRIADPSWTAVRLTPDMSSRLQNIDRNVASSGSLFVEALAEPQAGQPPSLLFPVAVNAPSPYLSDAVDQSFAALRQRVIVEAGWDFLGQLDGMFEALEARPLPGQSAQSWNKAGRAFDFYFREALGFDPQVQLVKLELNGEVYWRVFVRTAVQDGSQGEPLRTLTWDLQARSGDDPSYYEQGGKWRDAVPEGYYIDFTALAADYGWRWVPANDNWRTYFPDIRFWHYEKQDGLTWEEAMRELYSDEELVPVLERP
ncbi:TolB family protein [Candidatus Leptofilum sp.]|uniref:TolB family protein n=1 Tax=Candidatus Leptofilum sp. TaxID=3241576 RepID=UPI003B5B58E0